MRLGLIGAAILTVAGGAVAASPDAGTVLTLKGDCFVEAGGQRNPLKPGDIVHVGDTLDVADGAKLKLQLADGSVISAAPGTKVTVASLTVADGHRDADLSLAAGLLRAVVAPAAQPSHFEVETATGVAAVRSTDWFVESRTGMMRVGVLTGVVNLQSRSTGHGVDIPKGWGARVEAGKDPVPPRPWEHAEFQAVIDQTNLN